MNDKTVPVTWGYGGKVVGHGFVDPHDVIRVTITDPEVKSLLSDRDDMPYSILQNADRETMEVRLLGEPEVVLTPPVPIEYTRPNWTAYGLAMAATVALRADCTRRKVGAVLMLPDHSLVVSGYNGGPSGGPSCLAGECPRGRLSTEELPSNSAYDSGAGACIALHAEWNVLLRASWEQMRNSTLFVTCEPCYLCWNLIMGTPIGRVVWYDKNRNPAVKELYRDDVLPL